MNTTPHPPADATVAIPGYEQITPLPGNHSSTLYIARQLHFDRPVVIKTAPATLSDDGVAQIPEALLREARIAAQLHHAHIIRVHDLGLHQQLAYLAMDYHEGGNIKQRLQREMTAAQALTLVRQLASALDHIHAKGYVHGDISPEHILLTHYQQAVLSHFGQARSTQVEQTPLAQPSSTMRTQHYMSPEQLRGKTADPRSDFYSLGAVFYEMLQGSPPFDHPEITSLSMKILNAPPPALPPALSTLQPLLDRLLSKDITARYANGRELIADIDRLHEPALNQPLQRSRPLRAVPGDRVDIPRSNQLASTPSRVNRHRSNSAARRRRWPAIASGVVIIGLSSYLLASGMLAQWLTTASQSDHPQISILSRQVLALLPGSHPGTPAYEVQDRLIQLTGNEFSNALGSQVWPANTSGASLASGAAEAIGAHLANQRMPADATDATSAPAGSDNRQPNPLDPSTTQGNAEG